VPPLDWKRGEVKTRKLPALVFARVTAVAVVIYALVPSRVSITLVEDSVASDITRSRTSTAYVMGNERWVTFSVPPLQRFIKVVSNASVPAHLYPELDLTCEYTLRYQVLDSSGRILRDQVLSVRGRSLNYRDDKTGTVFPAQAYLGLPLVPLSSRTTVVNLEGLKPGAYRLKLALTVADPRVRDAIVRVYHREKAQQHELGYLWHRFSREKRERLARASVYGPDLLTEKEKQNLLQNRWVALAPQGIHGKDYQERKLYSLKQRERKAKAEGILPRGLFVTDGKPGTVPIPEGLGCIRFELQRIEDADGLAVVWLRWHRRDFATPVVSEMECEGARCIYREEFDGGLVEVEPSEDMVVRVFVEGLPEDMEITPVAPGIPGYVLRDDHPVEFSLVNPEGRQTALRLDVRRIHPEEAFDTEAPVSWRYELLDESRRQIAAGSIADVHSIARYDRVVGRFEGATVSNPIRRYLCLSPRYASVRIFSNDDGVCVSGYTRPYEFVRRLRVPEQYLEFERKQSDSKNWFPIRPDNYTECILNAGEAFFKVQTRPRQVADNIRYGNYHVETCDPIDEVDSYKILAPVEHSEFDRQLSPAYFANISPGRARSLDLVNIVRDPFIRPRIIYIGEDDSISVLRVFIDGKLHFELPQATNSNEAVLPPLAAGPHRVTVEAPEGSQVYLNNVAASTKGLHLERTVYWLGDEALRYQIEKKTAERETLSMGFYAEGWGAREVVLSVTILEANKVASLPVKSWTFTRNRYRIRQSGSGDIPVVGGATESLSGGELFFLTLGADLSPGPYKVHVELEEGSPGFFYAAQVIGARKERRSIFGEPGVILGESQE